MKGDGPGPREGYERIEACRDCRARVVWSGRWQRWICSGCGPGEERREAVEIIEAFGPSLRRFIPREPSR